MAPNPAWATFVLRWESSHGEYGHTRPLDTMMRSTLT
jgi:hypothetical protein